MSISTIGTGKLSTISLVGLSFAVAMFLTYPAAADVTYTFNISGGVITDADPGPTPITTVFNFDSVGDIGDILELEVRFSAEHTQTCDLGVVLISPLGTQVTLFDQLAAFGEDFQDTLFDDDAAKYIGESGVLPPYAGTYRVNPTSGDSLSDFDGEDPQGTWQLRVTDNYTDDYGYAGTGTLLDNEDSVPDGWGSLTGTQLYVTVPEPATISLLTVATALLQLRRKRRI